MVAKKTTSTAKTTKTAQAAETQASETVLDAKTEAKAVTEEAPVSPEPAAKKTAPKTAAKKVAEPEVAPEPAAEVAVPVEKAEEKTEAEKVEESPKATAKKAAPKTAAKKTATKATAKKAASKTRAKKTPEPEVAPEPVVEDVAPVEKAEEKLEAEQVQASPKPAAEVVAADEKAEEKAPEEVEASPEAVVEDAAPVEEPKDEPAPASPEPEPASSEAAEKDAAPGAQDVAVAPEFADVPGVLIAAAECAPLVKIGGLADVVGALPKYLKKLGVDARIIMPFHRQIKERYAAQAEHMCDFQASLGWRSQYVGLERLELDGTIYYFIDNEFYFGGPVYCGGEFEGEQYAFFTRAVMDSIPLLDFDVRILHCNDWHTAMMPLLAKTQYQGGMQAGLRTIQTIHNLHFQGQFSHEFDRDLLRIDDSLATPQFIEHYGCDNMLKAGIVFADKVNTVSPTYAREICTPEQGERLDGVLRTRGGDLWGILNGIDTDVWNPSADHNLPMSYSVKSLWRKARVRQDLLEELGLAPAGDETPVMSMVGRLTSQKGLDLVRWTLDEIMREDIRVIVLGTGDPELEAFFRDAEYRYKGRLCSYIGYNGELSHRIYAGSDLFLMPSLFEPCGISQMIALRYGTLPIVRETGGLKDTVIPYNQYTGEGNGFSFANYDAYEMLQCIRYAMATWRNPDARKQLISQAMATDYGFDRCARSYAELYRSVL